MAEETWRYAEWDAPSHPGAIVAGRSEGLGGDVARMAGMGLNSIARGAAGVAERFTGYGSGVRRWADREDQRFLREMRPETSRVATQGWGEVAGGDVPMWIGSQVVQALPGMAATGGSALLGRAVGAVGGATGRFVGAGAGGAAGNVALEAGGIFGQVASQIEALPPDQIRQSPIFQQLVRQGFSPEEAQQRAAQLAAARAFDLSAPTAALGGVVDTALMAGVGRFARIPGGLAGRTALGAGSEAWSEAVESGAGEFAQQQAMMALRDPDRPYTATDGTDWGKVREAAIGGAVVGGVMGGAFGAASSSAQRDGIAPDLRVALAGTPPPQPALPPGPMPQPTGDGTVINMPGPPGSIVTPPPAAAPPGAPPSPPPSPAGPGVAAVPPAAPPAAGPAAAGAPPATTPTEPAKARTRAPKAPAPVATVATEPAAMPAADPMILPTEPAAQEPPIAAPVPARAPRPADRAKEIKTAWRERVAERRQRTKTIQSAPQENARHAAFLKTPEGKRVRAESDAFLGSAMAELPEHLRSTLRNTAGTTSREYERAQVQRYRRGAGMETFAQWQARAERVRGRSRARIEERNKTRPDPLAAEAVEPGAAPTVVTPKMALKAKMDAAIAAKKARGAAPAPAAPKGKLTVSAKAGEILAKKQEIAATLTRRKGTVATGKLSMAEARKLVTERRAQRAAAAREADQAPSEEARKRLEARQAFQEDAYGATEDTSRSAPVDENEEMAMAAQAGASEGFEGPSDASRGVEKARAHVYGEQVSNASGTQSYEGGKERSTQSARARIAGDLLDDVLQGTKTAAEAAREYGRKAPGRGAPWKHKTFRDFIRHQIENPVTDAERAELEKRAGQPGAKLAYIAARLDPKGQEELLRVHREVATLRDEDLPEVGPAAHESKNERAASTGEPADAGRSVPIDEAAKAKYQAPPLSAAELARLKELKAELAKKPKARFSRASYAQALGNREINGVIKRFLDTQGVKMGGDVYEFVGEVARQIPELEHVAVLADRYAKLLRNTPIFTFRDVDRNAKLQFAGWESRPKDVAGLWMGKEDPDNKAGFEFIAVNTDGAALIETLIHEAVHPAVEHVVGKMEAGTAENTKLGRAFRLLLDRYKETISEDDEALSYAAQDAEFLTEALSNPYVQRHLASMRVSAADRVFLRGLGFKLEETTSLWKTFLGLLRRALGMPAEPGVESLLDYVVRLQQDVQVSNKAINPWEGAAATAKARWSIRSRAGEVTREAVRRADPGSWGDKAFSTTLAMRRLDQIARDYDGRVFQRGTLRAFADAETAVHRAADEFRDRFAPVVERATAFLSTPAGRQVGRLMTQATSAQIHPDRAFDHASHAHLPRDDTHRALHANLARQYAQLSPEAQRIYRETRDYFAQARREEIDALFNRALTAIAPDATPAQLDAIRRQVGTARGLRALQEADEAALTRMGIDHEALRDGGVRRALGRIYGLHYINGPYFPLRRFGNYVVEYRQRDYRSEPMTRDQAAAYIAAHPGTNLRMQGQGDTVRVTGELYGFEMFESKAEAQARERELRGNAALDVRPVESKRQFRSVDNAVGYLQLDALDQAIQRNPELRAEGDALRHALRSAMAEYLPEVAAARIQASMQRNNVAGASDDMARVMAQHYLAVPERMGYLREGRRRDDALGALRAQLRSDELRSEPQRQIDAQAIITELERRVEPVEDGIWTDRLRRLTPFGYVWSLLSPSLPIVNTLQTSMLATSVLGGRYGFLRSANAIARAQREIGFRAIGQGLRNTGAGLKRGLTRHDFQIFDIARENMLASTPAARRGEVGRLLDRLRAENLVDHTLQFDMREMAGSGTQSTTVGKMASHFLDVTSMLNHASDVNNRVVVAKAAFDLARQAGQSEAAAIRYAVDALNKSEPNFNTYNKARVFTARGPLGAMAAPIMQFKQGGQHLWDLLIVSMRDALRSDDPAVRREAQKTLGYILLTHGAMAGALGLAAAEPIAWALGAYSLLSGDDEPWDWQASARRGLADMLGPEAAEIAARGLPRALGVDLSQRVGIGGALNLPDIQKFDRASLATAAGEFVLGPIGSNASTAGSGIVALLKGEDPEKALQDALPRMFRDVVKAIGHADGETTDKRGRTIPLGDVGAWDTVLQGLGFTPAKVAETREQRGAVFAERSRMEKGSKKLVDAWLRADQAGRAAARQRIAEWNAENPAWRIDPKRLMSAQKERARQTRNSVGGVGLPRNPAQAAHLRDAGRFATVGS